MSHDVIDVDLERRAPPAEAVLFRHATRHLRITRVAAAAAAASVVVALVAGAPAIVTLTLVAVAAVLAWSAFDAQRRVASRPDHVEVSADGLLLAHTPRATTFAWSDVASLHHERLRARIVITRHDGRATELDADLDDRDAFLDAVTLHLDASRRTDISPALDRVRRPAVFTRLPWQEAVALATTAAGLVFGLLARPALFALAAIGIPALVWRWATDPYRVIVDDSAVWIVRRFRRDVIPLRAIRDVGFGMDGRPVAPSVVLDHRERGFIVLHGFGPVALPVYDAIMSALRAQRAIRTGAVAAVRSGARTPAPRSALATGGMLAAAVLVAVWITVLTGMPLRTAVRYDSSLMLNVALLMGAPRNAADEDGLTALHHAAQRNSGSMVRRLVRAGANVNATSSPNRYTPLHSAAQFRSVDAARALIEGGADVHARSARGRTPLAHALVFDDTPDIELARVLLDAGSDPNAPDDAGRTALHHAALNAHVAWIPLLARARGNLEARDTSGHAPVHLAVRSGSADALDALLDAGAGIDARGAAGRTPLASAVHDTNTPMPVVDRLLAARARVDVTGDDGWNAVQLAAIANNAPALELFARRRVPVDATSGTAPPALHIAIRNHHVDAVRALLRAGASPSRRFNGTSAYDVARQARNPTITALVRMR